MDERREPPSHLGGELCGGEWAGTMRPRRTTSALAYARIRERLRDLLALVLRALVPAKRRIVVALHVALAAAVDVPQLLLRRAVSLLGGIVVGLQRTGPVALLFEPLSVAEARSRDRVDRRLRLLG